MNKIEQTCILEDIDCALESPQTTIIELRDIVEKTADLLVETLDFERIKKLLAHGNCTFQTADLLFGAMSERPDVRQHAAQYVEDGKSAFILLGKERDILVRAVLLTSPGIINLTDDDIGRFLSPPNMGVGWDFRNPVALVMTIKEGRALRGRGEEFNFLDIYTRVVDKMITEG